MKEKTNQMQKKLKTFHHKKSQTCRRKILKEKKT